MDLLRVRAREETRVLSAEEARRLIELREEAVRAVARLYEGGAPGLASPLTGTGRVIDTVIDRMLREPVPRASDPMDFSAMQSPSAIRQVMVRARAEALVGALSNDLLTHPNLPEAVALEVARTLRQDIEAGVMRTMHPRRELIDGRPVEMHHLVGVTVVSKFLSEFVPKLSGISRGVEGARISTPEEIERSLIDAATSDPARFMQTPLADLVRGHIRLEFRLPIPMIADSDSDPSRTVFR